MNKRNEVQNRKLHMLINAAQKAGYQVEKAELVSFFTNGRTSSSRELYYHEAEKLIKHLEQTTGNPAHITRATTQADKADKMRKNVIAICYELGWIESTHDPEQRKINRDIIDSFLKQRGYLKKPLNDFTLKELPKLVTQFKLILEHSKQTAGNKATKNLLAELNIPVQPAKKK